jgi:hypothetical protein
LLANSVFLLIEGFLVGLGDVAAVMACHRTFFLADCFVFLMQRGRLGLRDFAALHFVVDALILIRQAIVDLLAAWVVLLPRGVFVSNPRLCSLGATVASPPEKSAGFSGPSPGYWNP